MKEEFYCLPLKKKVKAKITAVVKKKSYALKGVHKVGDKSYNLNKTCSKARAEEVASALGIEIEHTAAAETLAVPEDSFIPDGTGSVIGQNTAGMKTAIPATEETPTANTTPFHSYHIVKITGVKPYKIKTVDFGAEDDKKNCGCGKDPCITYGADGYKKSRSSSDEEEDVIEGAMEDEEADDIPQGFSPTDEKTVQFEDGTLMSPSKEAETGGVSYAIEPDHWLRLQAHRDWQATREEVNVERENNFWVITGPQESADDILDLIIDTADNTLADMTPVSSAGISKGVTLGIGVLGLAASIMLLQRFNKSD